MLLRLIVVLLFSAAFGLAVGMLAGAREKARLWIFLAASAALGLLAAHVLELSYPVLFDHLLSWQSWFEWSEFLSAPAYLPLFLARSLILLPLGFAAGFGASRLVGKSASPAWSLAYVLSFLAGFSVCWWASSEHLPSGVSSRVYVYRIAGSESGDDGKEFASFLDWNLSPHSGYEIYSRGLSLDFFSGSLKLEIGKSGPPVYVFVKEYLAHGSVCSTIRTSRTGYMSASELGDCYRNFARARTSVN